jgi:hypothetical protein
VGSTVVPAACSINTLSRETSASSPSLALGAEAEKPVHIVSFRGVQAGLHQALASYQAVPLLQRCKRLALHPWAFVRQHNSVAFMIT